MSRVSFAGKDRSEIGWNAVKARSREPVPPPPAPTFVALRPGLAAPVLRMLRTYVAGTPGITPRGIVDKIDDMLWGEQR